MTMKIIADILGWSGTILIVTAYALVSWKKLSISDRHYQLMNIFGAVGIGVNVFWQRAWPALALQIVWGLIALIALVKILRKKS